VNNDETYTIGVPGAFARYIDIWADDLPEEDSPTPVQAAAITAWTQRTQRPYGRGTEHTVTGSAAVFRVLRDVAQTSLYEMYGGGAPLDERVGLNYTIHRINGRLGNEAYTDGRLYAVKLPSYFYEMFTADTNTWGERSDNPAACQAYDAWARGFFLPWGGRGRVFLVEATPDALRFYQEYARSFLADASNGMKTTHRERRACQDANTRINKALAAEEPTP
jgi:hypothetical protein